MVMRAASGLTSFYDVNTPGDLGQYDSYYPAQTLEGEYQLEIRRGTEYGSTPDQTTTSDAFADQAIQIDQTYHTNTRFVTNPASPTLVLAQNEFNVIDGLDVVEHGNGDISLNGGLISLDDAVTAAAGVQTNNMLAWNVELAGQPSAFLSYIVTRNDKLIQPLPSTFTYNAWDDTVDADAVVGLPEGDGVAVSIDGGTQWTAVDSFGWNGSRVVDLVGRLGPLTDNTVIGFFRSSAVPDGADLSIQLSNVVVTAAPPVITTGTIGDANNTHEFEQGQFIIASNIISNAADYGVRIDSGRDSIGNAPHAGAARNFPTLLNSRLVPGVVVSNNVIHASGAAGVSYAGAIDDASMPNSVRPFGRILNNTIVGTDPTAGVGVDVSQNASATLMNNVFANLGTGVAVDSTSVRDASGEKLTEIDTSVFYLVGNQVTGAEQKNGELIPDTETPFVDITNGNFYPTSSTAIVDSAFDSLQDRQPSIVEKAAIGIPQSPIVSPSRDLFGQNRADDPDSVNKPGLGFDPFKDRGAIERVDRSAPTARLVMPLDQGSFGQIVDVDSDLDEVRLTGRDARGVQQFVIQLTDVGVGVDKNSVVTNAVSVIRDGVTLTDGVDYFFSFNKNTNQIILASTVVYGLGDYFVELRSDVDQGVLIDLAGNPLFANAQDSEGQLTSFAIELADVPNAPTFLTARAADGKVILDWNEPITALSSPVDTYFIEYADSSDGGTTFGSWTLTSVSAGVKALGVHEEAVPNNTLRKYRVSARNNIGLGAWTEEIFASPSQPINVTGELGIVNNVQAGAVKLSWDAPVNNGGFPPTHYVIDRINVADSILSASSGVKAELSSDGSKLFYFTTNNELEIYDITDSTAPALLGAWVNDGSTGKDIAVSSDTSLAYIVDADGLKILDVTDPSAVSVLGSYQNGNSSERLVLNNSNSLAILSSGEIVDVSSSTVPELSNVGSAGSSQENFVESWVDATVIDNQLFMITSSGEFIAYDITDPAIPLQIFNYSLNAAGSSSGGGSTGTGVGVEVQGTFAFVAHESNGLMAFDISNPLSLQLMSQLDVGGVPVNIAMHGQQAYVATADGSVSVCDISVPSRMSVLETRVIDGKSDLLVSDSGSLLIGVGEAANEKVYVVDATTSWTRVDVEITGTSHTITGLDKGVEQYFRVAAVNSVSQGTWTENSEIFTPEGVPDAPENFMASLNLTDGSIDLTWNVPAYDGGDAIQDYTVMHTKGEETPTEVHVPGGATVSLNLTTLERGADYTFKVKATFDRGFATTIREQCSIDAR